MVLWEPPGRASGRRLIKHKIRHAQRDDSQQESLLMRNAEIARNLLQMGTSNLLLWNLKV